MGRKTSDSGCGCLLILGLCVCFWSSIADAVGAFASYVGTGVSSFFSTPFGIPTVLAILLLGIVFAVAYSPAFREWEVRQRALKARQEAERKESERREKLKRDRVERHREAHAALSALFASADQLVFQHREALRAQFRSSVYTDPYGQLVRDRWVRELEYFVGRVLIPQLDPHIGDFESARANLLVTMAEVGGSPERLSVPPRSVAAMLQQHVDAAFPKTAKDTSVHQNAINDVCSGDDYERHCADLLRSVGWRITERGGCGDQGVDLLGVKDSAQVAFQCKWHSRPVGNDSVQQAHTGATILGTHHAAVISRSGYTEAARIAAHATGVFLLTTEDLTGFKPY